MKHAKSRTVGRINRNHILLPCLVVTLIVGGFVIIATTKMDTSSDEPGRGHGNADRSSRQTDDIAARERQREVNEVREAWRKQLLGIPRDSQSALESDRALARDSVERLGLSPELLGLMLGLQSEMYVLEPTGNFPDTRRLFIEIVDEMLRDDVSGKLRDQLIEMLAWREIERLDSTTEIRSTWLAALGAGLGKDQLDHYLDGIEGLGPQRSGIAGVTRGQQYRQQVVLGYCGKYMSEYPDDVIPLLRDQLNKGISTTTLGAALRDIVNAIPEDSDFLVLQHGLLEGRQEEIDHESPMGQMQRMIIGKWAPLAPADAANFIMDHSHILHSRLLGSVVNQVARRDPINGYRWALTFPKGEFRDTALSACVVPLHFQTEKIRELAAQIEDEDLRAGALAQAEVYEDDRRRAIEGRPRVD